MNLAATLGLYLIGLGSLGLGSPGLGWLPPHAHESAAVRSSDSLAQQSQDAPVSQSQAPPSQTAPPTQPAPTPTIQTPNSPNQAKKSPARPRHRRKPAPANCSTAPTALNTAAGSPSDATDSKGASSTNAGSRDAAATNASSTALKPCPPPKKVIRNGGSDEPAVQLTGGTTAEQAVHQRSTDQLTAATNENLKKIVGRQLNPSQQEMASQIKQFMAQSKTAVAAGDLERGHDLALKAHLLSDELVKP
jgi:hypothetical protein